MLTAPAGVVSYVNANNVAWRADLYTMTFLDGTIYRWTTSDRDLTVGGKTFLANGAVLGRGNLRSTSKLEVDSLDVELGGPVLLRGSTGIEKTISLLAILGTFDEARMQIDHLVGPDMASAIALGPVAAWYEGRVAGVQPGPDIVRVSIERGDDLNTRLPRFAFQPMCRNAVYDPNCTLVRASFTDSGFLSTPGTQTLQSTSPAIIARANGYYNLGVLVLTSGKLNQVRRAVRTFSVSAGVATFGLSLALPFAPANFESFTVYPGCHDTMDDCGTAKFNNLVNFRGFPHIPAPEGGM